MISAPVTDIMWICGPIILMDWVLGTYLHSGLHVLVVATMSSAPNADIMFIYRHIISMEWFFATDLDS